MPAGDVWRPFVTAIRALPVDPDLDRVTANNREIPSLINTCMFNLTGHPAISVPCRKPDGRPVGMMLVGAHGDDATLLTLAAAYEDAVDWTTA